MVYLRTKQPPTRTFSPSRVLTSACVSPFTSYRHCFKAFVNIVSLSRYLTNDTQMTTSGFDSYEVAPTPFRTGNVHLSPDYVQRRTQAEHNFNPATFQNRSGPSWLPSSCAFYAYGSIQTPVPLPEAQQEPNSPSSGYFPALTPSETSSIILSDYAIGVSGRNVEESSLAENGSLEDLGRQIDFSGGILTPSTSRASNGIGGPASSIHDWSESQEGFEEGLLRLRETDNQGNLMATLCSV